MGQCQTNMRQMACGEYADTILHVPCLCPPGDEPTKSDDIDSKNNSMGFCKKDVTPVR